MKRRTFSDGQIGGTTVIGLVATRVAVAWLVDALNASCVAPVGSSGSARRRGGISARAAHALQDLRDEVPFTGVTMTNVTVMDVKDSAVGVNVGVDSSHVAIGAAWLSRRRAWGYVIGGTRVVMLTIETAGIAIDQAFGHLHDTSASLGAVPIMVAFTVAGLAFSAVFLRGMGARSRSEKHPAQ